MQRREGLAWHTNPSLIPQPYRDNAPYGYYDVGVAHGNPGVVAFLSKLYTLNIEPIRVKLILEKSIPWILAQQMSTEGEVAFPYSVGHGVKPKQPRTAWCYGDPGVAMSLFLAARAVNESDWEREALTIAIRVASRPYEKTGVVDAGICHGASGLAHIFLRLYQKTLDNQFLIAARCWFERVLHMRQSGRGIGGFLMGRDGNFSPIPGFLTGSAGVGLCLLAGLTSLDPAWDRILLVS